MVWAPAMRVRRACSREVADWVSAGGGRLAVKWVAGSAVGAASRGEDQGEGDGDGQGDGNGAAELRRGAPREWESCVRFCGNGTTNVRALSSAKWMVLGRKVGLFRRGRALAVGYHHHRSVEARSVVDVGRIGAGAPRPSPKSHVLTTLLPPVTAAWKVVELPAAVGLLLPTLSRAMGTSTTYARPQISDHKVRQDRLDVPPDACHRFTQKGASDLGAGPVCAGSRWRRGSALSALWIPRRREWLQCDLRPAYCGDLCVLPISAYTGCPSIVSVQMARGRAREAHKGARTQQSAFQIGSGASLADIHVSSSYALSKRGV